MKTLHLAIIVIFAVCLVIIQSNSIIAYADTRYYDQIPVPPIQILSANGGPLDIAIKQGESLQVPVTVKLDKGYEMTSLVNFMMNEIPHHIHAWFDTNSLSNRTKDQQLFNVTMYLYADSNAPLGKYTVKIIASGLIVDLKTGQAIQVMNFTAAQVPQGNPIEDSWKHIISSSQVLGVSNLTVLPVSNPVSMDIGSPDVHSGTFCMDMGNGGRSCGGFGTYTEFPITTSSQKATNVTLHAFDIPYGGWVKFSPPQLAVGPSGSSAKMIVAGVVQPYGGPPPDTRAMKVQALSGGKSVALSYVPLIKGHSLSVLNSSGPIDLDGQIINNINGTNFNTFGVVYDAENSSEKSLPVNLSVLGLHDSNASALPPWIKVKIPKSSFILNDSIPYYFTLGTITTNAPVGLHQIAIKENVGDKTFVSNLQLQIMKPICIGGPGMCGPQPTPQEKQARTYLQFPFDVTTDSQGNIYVADSSDDRIVKFDPSGNYVMQFGTSGRGNGQFMEPRGVAVDGSGDIYVADTTNNRIEKFDPSGKFLLKFGSDGTGKGEFHGPYSIAVGKSGNVYVGDVGNARVQKFDSDGNFILEFGSRGRGNGQFDDLGRIAVDNSGYVYVTDVLQGIEKFDSKGDYISNIPLKATLSGNNAPDAYGIALDNKGGIFVAGDNQARIQKFDPQGNFVSEFGSFGSGKGQFNHPGAIAIDPSRYILVADSDNNRIEKIDSSGKFISEIDKWQNPIHSDGIAPHLEIVAVQPWFYNGWLLTGVVVSAVVGSWFFLFRRFKGD